MAQIFLLIVLVGVTAAFPAIAPTPVVLWHGLGIA